MRKLTPQDKWRVEHVLALENGGSDDECNLDLTCAWCWPDKDREDHAKAAKSRHVRTKHVVGREPKGRPMPGSRKSNWKRKISGEWVRR